MLVELEKVVKSGGVDAQAGPALLTLLKEKRGEGPVIDRMLAATADDTHTTPKVRAAARQSRCGKGGEPHSAIGPFCSTLFVVFLTAPPSTPGLNTRSHRAIPSVSALSAPRERRSLATNLLAYPVASTGGRNA